MVSAVLSDPAETGQVPTGAVCVTDCGATGAMVSMGCTLVPLLVGGAAVSPPPVLSTPDCRPLRSVAAPGAQGAESAPPPDLQQLSISRT